MVNRDKSAVFFSKNCSDEAKEEVRTALHIDTEALAEKYLGLPTAVGRSTSESFEFLPTRIRNLIGTWSGREASQAGREVLLKSVAQAVPTYSMSCFLLSKTTCKKVRSPMANYWWGSSANSKRIHWQSWERLTYPKAVGGMGFRDTRNFNLAMLGKQGWRLLMFPDSLCARVLKGRYYNDSSFLTTTRKKHASHTWRAILAGREVLTQGLIRRIGNGETTLIWRDRWLPNHFSGQPLTPSEGQLVSRVGELLSENGQWDEALIRQIFFPIDAEAILRTPVRPNHEDFWAWEPEKFGMYSVKSAYRLLDTRRINESNLQAESVSENTDWNKLWKLKVPPKVKVFWWRVINEFLPTRQILHKKHIEPIANCDLCGADSESIRHVLMECSVAKSFWEYMKSTTGAKLPMLHPDSWAFDLISCKGVAKQDQAVFLIGMYALWMQRNRSKHGEPSRPIKFAVQWAVDMAFDLQQAGSAPLSVKPQGTPLWQKPEAGWLKCNTDGAFYDRHWKGASGAVLRDDNGAFIRACARWYDNCLDVLTSEALACRDGLQLARHVNASKVWLETDSQEVLRLWEVGENCRSTIGPILEEIRVLSRGFESFKFSYVTRSCNEVAHTIAKQVTGMTRLGWWSCVPACVMNLVTRECNSIPNE